MASLPKARIEAPISSTVEDETANVSLKYSSRDFEIGPENDLQSKNPPLIAEAPLWIDKQAEETVVGLHYDAPFYTSEHGLSLMTDATTSTIDSEGKLKSIGKNFETPLQEVDGVDGKLGVDQKELSKGIGAISVYSAMDESIPGVGDWIDIPDLPGDMEEYIGNGTLTLTAPRFEAEAIDYSITEPRQLPTAGYVHQLYQSQAGSGIDVGEVANGRKLIKVNHDTTLNINESNQLKVNVPTIADGTSVKAVNGKLTVDPYTAGDGISIADNVVSSTLTYGGSLRREGDQVIGKTVISGSSNVTVVQTNPFSYEVSVLNPQSQIDNLDDKQELKSDLLSKDITTNRGNINQLNTAKNQIQGDLISLGAEVTGLTGVVDTVNTVATGVQVAQALMKGDVTSLQGIVTGIAGEVTGLSSTVAAIQAMPVVRGVIGIGVIAAQDPVTGIVTITNTSAPLMAEKPTAPVNPTDKGGGGGTLKDTYKNEEGGGGGGGLNGGGSVGESSSGLAQAPDNPILPPIDPVDLQNTGRIGGTDGNDLLPCLNGLPPIFKGCDDKGENTWFVDSWGRRWSEELQLEIIEDGIERSVIELDEHGVPVTEKGHIDIILRGSDDDRISTAILTHDRHLQSGYIQQGGILFEHPTTVPNIAMVYEAYEKYILPYVESCNYINVSQGLVKDGNTLSLSEDLSTFAKTSSLKALAFKDTLAYSDLTGRPTLGSLATKNSIAWTEVTSRPTLGSLSTKNTVDWNGTDILNKPTDLTTKTYVDSLAYLTAGAGLTKTGNTLSINGSQITTLGTLNNLSISGTITATSNLNGDIVHSLRNTSSDTSARTYLRLENGRPASGLNLFLWSSTHSYYPNVGTLANFSGPLKLHSMNAKGLSIDTAGYVTSDLPITTPNPTAAGHLTTKGYVDALSYLSVRAGLVKTGNTISLGSDLSGFEVKSNLKALAYKDKVDYATDLINVPASVTYGSNLLFSNNTVSLNPVLTGIDSLTATGNLNLGGTLNLTRNVNGGYTQYIYNSSTGSSSCTALQMRAGGGTGLYININAQARADFGGGNTATIMNYSGALRFLSQRGKGIIVDEHGAVDVSERLSVGTLSDVVPFPPANLTADSTTVSGQAYGNGTYVATASSIYSNSTSYSPWKAFASGPWYCLINSYSATAPYEYVGGITTLVDSVPVNGEWLQLSLPAPIV
ncbi:hypothetical protein BC832DRAFT_541979 [Gaertneriomyces semiglobifer]|nr:hypothetical protein BC832DRAFT_541979 [Gaertneriomyces semiglobifer]